MTEIHNAYQQSEKEKTRQSIEKQIAWLGTKFVHPVPIMDRVVSGKAELDRNYIRVPNLTLQWKMIYGMCHNQDKITIMWGNMKQYPKCRFSNIAYTHDLWKWMKFFFAQEVNREREQGLVMEGPANSIWDSARVDTISYVYQDNNVFQKLLIHFMDGSRQTLFYKSPK